jgi:hypothetical protein
MQSYFILALTLLLYDFLGENPIYEFWWEMFLWIYLVLDPTLVSKVVLTLFIELFLVCDLF